MPSGQVFFYWAKKPISNGIPWIASWLVVLLVNSACKTFLKQIQVHRSASGGRIIFEVCSLNTHFGFLQLRKVMVLCAIWPATSGHLHIVLAIVENLPLE